VRAGEGNRPVVVGQHEPPVGSIDQVAAAAYAGAFVRDPQQGVLGVRARPAMWSSTLCGSLWASIHITKLRDQGIEVVAASPASGVNTITGEGLDDALRGASVVVDVSNSPSFEDAAALEFFQTSTGNLLAAEVAAGVEHHVALSVVGTQRLAASGYFLAKIAQEKLITESSIPYSIVHATQFFGFIKNLAAFATDSDGDTVRFPSVLIQPMAADDVAGAVGKAALAAPVNGVVEVAGPEQFRLDELIRRTLSEGNDPREVITDPRVRYAGAQLTERTLVPGDGAALGAIRYQDWLSQNAVAS